MYVFCFLFLGAVVVVTRSREGRDRCVSCGRSGSSLQVEELPGRPKDRCLRSQGRDVEVSSHHALVLSTAALLFSFPLVSLCRSCSRVLSTDTRLRCLCFSFRFLSFF